jgi:hypothetical protein
LNIAHLHFRFARQASERDGQLGATITLTRQLPARLILIFCGIAGPIMIAGVTLPKVLLPMCFSSGVERPVPNRMFETAIDRQVSPVVTGVK